MENRFWKLAHDAQRYQLANACEPGKGNVTEAKQAELDRFIFNARILMTTFGHKVFDSKVPVTPTPETPASRNILFHFDRAVKGVGHIHAEAKWTTEGIAVLKGSQILVRDNPGLSASVKTLRDSLIEEGSITPVSGVVYELQIPQIFSSPSTAGSFVLGASCNGRKYWVTPDGKTFGEFLGDDAAAGEIEANC